MSDNVASLKSAGDNAYKAGNLDEAIDAYTKAIDAAKKDNANADVLKALYSNRAASYAQSKNFNSSLLDAEKCIELDSTWVKGIIRKGDALYSLRRLNEAMTTYKSGLEISPNDSSLKGKIEQVERAIYQASQPPPPSSSYANMINSPMLNNVQGYLRFGLVLFLIGWLIPFIGKSFNVMSYRALLINAVASFLISLYLRHGFPRISQDYLQRIIFDQPTSAYLFMTVILFAQKPYFLPLISIILVEGFALVKSKAPALLGNPAVASQLATVEQQMPALMGRSDWSRLSTATKWNVAEEKVWLVAATCEVWQGIFFLVELILPSRALLGTVMWWQYLQMRCMMSNIPGSSSSPIMRAFSQLDAKISTVVGHQYCPQAVRKGYDFIRQQARQRIQLPDPASQPTGMMDSVRSMMPSSCNIS